MVVCIIGPIRDGCFLLLSLFCTLNFGFSPCNAEETSISHLAGVYLTNRIDVRKAVMYGVYGVYVYVYYCIPASILV